MLFLSMLWDGMVRKIAICLIDGVCLLCCFWVVEIKVIFVLLGFVKF